MYSVPAFSCAPAQRAAPPELDGRLQGRSPSPPSLCWLLGEHSREGGFFSPRTYLLGSAAGLAGLVKHRLLCRVKAPVHKHDTWIAVPAPQKDLFRSSSKLVLIEKRLARR